MRNNVRQVASISRPETKTLSTLVYKQEEREEEKHLIVYWIGTLFVNEQGTPGMIIIYGLVQNSAYFKFWSNGEISTALLKFQIRQILHNTVNYYHAVNSLLIHKQCTNPVDDQIFISSCSSCLYTKVDNVFVSGRHIEAT